MTVLEAAPNRWVRVGLSAAAQRVVADRGGLAVAAGLYVTVVAVLTNVWRVAADASGGEVAGYSAVALTWYIAASEAVTIALNLRLIADVGDDIGSGAVAAELLRPAPVLWVRVVGELGRVLPRLTLCAAVGVVLSTVVAGPPPRPLALLLAAPSLVLAAACNLVAQFAFASAAFWLRRAGSAWFLYQKLVFVLGGMLIPLEALPGRAEQVAHLLPFQAMAYAPARLASGHVEPWILVVQLAWLVPLCLLAGALFRAGERRLQVVGG